jgi:hypothetical protein
MAKGKSYIIVDPPARIEVALLAGIGRAVNGLAAIRACEKHI